MDKRLIVEVIPGPAFLAGHAVGGIFVGAAVAAVATAIAVYLRWRWDRAIPLMALSIFALTIVLLAFGFVFNDPTFIKMTNTIGSLAFAGVITVGMRLTPSLLERTLGHSLHMSPQGWRTLHLMWIALSLARAVANEAVWRTTADKTWAICNGVSDIAWIGVFVAITWILANRYWVEREATNAKH